MKSIVMFQYKFTKYEKDRCSKSEYCLPSGYIFKYRMGVTTAIHYTGKEIILEKDFNYTVRFIIATIVLASTTLELNGLRKIQDEKEVIKKEYYENLPQYIKSLCEKKLNDENYIIILKKLYERQRSHTRMRKCIENGGDPEENYYCPRQDSFIYMRNTHRYEIPYYVDYNNDKKVIYNCVVVKKLIEQSMTERLLNNLFKFSNKDCVKNCLKFIY
jgi:hypothetical protein